MSMRHIIFGESHGPAIGVVLEGVPAGIELNLACFKDGWREHEEEQLRLF